MPTRLQGKSKVCERQEPSIFVNLRKDILTLVVSNGHMMNCPNCGSIMVWLNGSVLHDPPVKEYECRQCQLFVVKYPDGNYETKPIEPQSH